MQNSFKIIDIRIAKIKLDKIKYEIIFLGLTDYFFLLWIRERN